MSNIDNLYNVVYEYGEDAGGYCGVRFWTSYKDKADFDKSFAEPGAYKLKVLAEGVTQEEAMHITSGTSPHARIRAAAQEAAEMPAFKEIILLNTLTAIALDQEEIRGDRLRD